MRSLVLRLCTLLIVSLLIITSVAACDKVQPSDSEGISQSQSQTEREFDFNGRVITINSWFDNAPKEDTDTGARQLRRNRYTEEKYNVKIEYTVTASDNYGAALSASILAGDPLGDLMMLQSHFWHSFIRNNLLFPMSDLDEIIHTDDNEIWQVEMMNEHLKHDGKLYGLIHRPSSPQLYAGTIGFYNKTYFNRLGLEDPQELQFKNEWTWDKMVELAQKLHRNNVDGTVDIWGAAGVLDTYGWVYSNGGNVMRKEDNRQIFALAESNAVEAMQFYQDIINTERIYGAINPDGAAWDWSANAFKEGKVGMFFGEFWLRNYLKDMEDEWRLVAFPRGPKADEHVTMHRVSSARIMPAGIQKADEVAQVMLTMGKRLPDEEYNPNQWRIDGENLGFDEGSLDTIEMLFYNQRLDLYSAFPEFENFLWVILWHVQRATNTASAVIEEQSIAAQALLDDYMDE